MKQVLLARMPSLLTLLWRLMTRKSSRKNAASILPQTCYRVKGVSIDPHHLQRYRALIEDPRSGDDALPICYPHLLCFPLQVEQLVAPEFPLPLLGLVHLRNRIRMVRPLTAEMVLDFETELGELRETVKGQEFDLWSRVYHDNELVWEGCSTNLLRAPAVERAASSSRSIENTLEHRQRWSLPANLGFHYARLAGDYNPIHLHSLLARLFGFRRAIIHGMWSKARCLGTIFEAQGYPEAEVIVECTFKTPVFLPNEVLMSWQPASAKETQFLLQNSQANMPHLSGQVLLAEGAGQNDKGEPG